MDRDTLSYHLDTKSVLLCHDIKNASYGRGLLRSIPAVSHLFEMKSLQPQFTYPKQWRQLGNVEQFDMYPQDWVLLQNISNVSRPLGVVTNQHYEQESPYSIRPALDAVRDAGETAFVVSDTEEFKYQGEDRPIEDHGYAYDLGPYQDIYEAIKDEYRDFDYTLPLSDTKNLFFQDNAILYNEIYAEGDRVTTVKELFSVISDCPYLPLYSSLTRIFNRTESYGAKALPEDELDAFRKWIQHRLDRSFDECREIAELLNGQVLQQQTRFTHASQVEHPSLDQVNEFMETMSPETNRIEKKYQQWLRGTISHEF